MASRPRAALALPPRPRRAICAARRHRAQPRQPQLHPRPAAGKQHGRVPRERRARRVHARLGRPGRARRRQRPRDVRRRLPAARARRGPARDRLPRGHARGLLPRRAHGGPLRGRPRRRGRAQPRPDGDADRLRRDGLDGRRPARGPAERRGPHRRHRQRPGRGALQRLLHARPDDGDRPEGDAAREPVERPVRRGLPGDGPVVARPRSVPRRRVPRGRGAARARERPHERADPRRRPQSSTSPACAVRCSSRWPSATTSCRRAPPSPLSRSSATPRGGTRCASPAGT